MVSLLLWAAFWIFLALVVMAFVVRGTKRRVLKQRQEHPYLQARREQEKEEAEVRAAHHQPTQDPTP